MNSRLTAVSIIGVFLLLACEDVPTESWNQQDADQAIFATQKELATNVTHSSAIQETPPVEVIEEDSDEIEPAEQAIAANLHFNNDVFSVPDLVYTPEPVPTSENFTDYINVVGTMPRVGLVPTSMPDGVTGGWLDISNSYLRFQMFDTPSNSYVPYTAVPNWPPDSTGTVLLGNVYEDAVTNMRLAGSDVQVFGSPTLAELSITPAEDGSGDDSQIRLCEDDNCSYSMFMRYDGGANKLQIFGQAGVAVYGPHLTIHRNSGNVGIGTTYASHPLTVNGAIRAKELIIETGWSDYVFDQDYILPSIEETEQYIAANGHLPGVPSAEQVAAEGVSVGESQATLLRKIEELTLYVIEQNKEMATLRTNLSQLSNELAVVNQTCADRNVVSVAEGNVQ